MKKKIYIIACLIALIGLISSMDAQKKINPPSDKEISFDKAPAVVKQVQPEYPASMLKGGWEATVYMKAFIDVEGNVAEAKAEKIQIIATKSAEKPEESVEQKGDGKAFEESAYNAVKQWKFTPAQMQGKAVGAWVTIPFRFKLSTEKISPEEQADRAETEKSIEAVKTAIENILQGKDLEKAKKYVGKTAQLIYNTKSANLLSVLNGEQKNISLTEGKKAQCVNFNVNITDAGKSALIIWTSENPKGKNKRIHSIILTKSDANSWKVLHWHVSF